MSIVRKFLSDICIRKKNRNSSVTQTSMEFLDPALIYEGNMHMPFLSHIVSKREHGNFHILLQLMDET